jgi:hypothetical protein
MIKQGDRVKIGYRTGKCGCIEGNAAWIVFDDVPHFEARWFDFPKGTVDRTTADRVS